VKVLRRGTLVNTRTEVDLCEFTCPVDTQELDQIVSCFHFFGTPKKVSPDLAQNFMRRVES
jgi:hypothetical protein